MQNAEHNLTQAQQKDMAARSPAKTPAAGAAGPDAKTQAREFGSTTKAGSATPRDVRDTTPLPETQPPAEKSADPLADARRKIRSVEVAGTAASGNTVDADGKTLEARRDITDRHDNIVSSNATVENHVPVAPDGLGGFDSRFVGAVPRIRTLPGYRVEVQGYVSIEGRNGGHQDVIISLERED